MEPNAQQQQQKPRFPRFIIIVVIFLAGFSLLAFATPSKRAAYYSSEISLGTDGQRFLKDSGVPASSSASRRSPSSVSVTGSFFAPSGAPILKNNEKSAPQDLGLGVKDAINAALQQYKNSGGIGQEGGGSGDYDDNALRALPPDVSHPDPTPVPPPAAAGGRVAPPATTTTFLPPISLPPVVSPATGILPRESGNGAQPFPARHLVDGIGNATTMLVVEVGTNFRPDFWPLVWNQESVYFLMVEPVTLLQSMKWCKGMFHRCGLIAAAASNYDGIATFRMASMTACSSMLSGGLKKSCATAGAAEVKVATHRLDTMLARVPRRLPIFISLDAQGMDFWAAAGVAGIQQQVVGLVVECQDLSTSKKLYWAPGRVKSCGEIVSCVETQWPGWEFTGCARNAGPGWGIRGEMNCHFHRRKQLSSSVDSSAAELGRKWRHPLNVRERVILRHNYSCNVEHWRRRTALP